LTLTCPGNIDRWNLEFSRKLSEELTMKKSLYMEDLYREEQIIGILKQHEAGGEDSGRLS
jgi:hypothetical protein